MEKSKKNYIQVNKIIIIFILFIGSDKSEKKLDISFLGLMNLSFQSRNNEEDIPEESPKNPYITKDHVPELEIIDKNTITCDKIKYEIKDYIKMINNTPNEFIDDIEKYNHCGKCKNDLNKYFCENCQENICDKCYKECKIKKHNFIDLEEMKEKSNSYLSTIKKLLSNNIIPLKEYNENSIKEENDEVFLLIIEIISQDYTNFFHLKNIKNILGYIAEIYLNKYKYPSKKYEGIGKLIFYNGGYYIGQFKDNLPNGKGKIYFPNGNIRYDGEIKNFKREGNGKFFYNDGYYYIGQFKDNKFHGKGTEYNKNGNIIYEGDFINGKREGNGKLFTEKGYYYIGQFKDDLLNGKGIQYYKNGNIAYEGDFINGVCDGKGKMINIDGSYYIGQFKDDLPNGKGITYDKDGNIMYEGESKNLRKEGNGKLINKDGSYYIGQFKDNEFHGKGIQYDKNGNIVFEGDFINGKREGIGKIIDKDGNYYIGQFKNDLRNGKGKVFLSNGIIIYDGIFINDKSTLNCIIN